MSPRGRNRTTESCADHLSRTSCPAPVFAWIGDGNGQIVAASVVSLARAGRATSEIVSARLAPPARDMFEDEELAASAARRNMAPGGVGRKRCFVRYAQVRQESRNVIFGDSLQTAEICNLVFQSVVSAVKPVALSGGAMNA